MSDRLIYATACSIHQLANTIQHVDADRAAQLVRHADAMLAQWDNGNRMACDAEWVSDCLADLSEYKRYLMDAVDNLMAEIPATYAHPAGV